MGEGEGEGKGREASASGEGGPSAQSSPPQRACQPPPPFPEFVRFLLRLCLSPTTLKLPSTPTPTHYCLPIHASPVHGNSRTSQPREEGKWEKARRTRSSRLARTSQPHAARRDIPSGLWPLSFSRSPRRPPPCCMCCAAQCRVLSPFSRPPRERDKPRRRCHRRRRRGRDTRQRSCTSCVAVHPTASLARQDSHPRPTPAPPSPRELAIRGGGERPGMRARAHTVVPAGAEDAAGDGLLGRPGLARCRRRSATRGLPPPAAFRERGGRDRRRTRLLAKRPADQSHRGSESLAFLRVLPACPQCHYHALVALPPPPARGGSVDERGAGAASPRRRGQR